MKRGMTRAARAELAAMEIADDYYREVTLPVVIPRGRNS